MSPGEFQPTGSLLNLPFLSLIGFYQKLAMVSRWGTSSGWCFEKSPIFELCHISKTTKPIEPKIGLGWIVLFKYMQFQWSCYTTSEWHDIGFINFEP